ncbi:hypothetical protein AMTRI_Chr08g204460 [Amborella trichopoda]|uniref:Protein TIFY n=1 Tax=Amborella trichopoda TaxID=13333 RepID=W1PJG5_AMBTC|nr:uncharacterized protein LOC18436030 [Amborella trichopoda]ERN07796.1 hypothetical protein AMTR_s00012p00148380 [Amborella trichopoda]|eukprot:XP_006846121.1 uncharacterized protein LOC18436030 [Amborella trichopoda]
MGSKYSDIALDLDISSPLSVLFQPLPGLTLSPSSFRTREEARNTTTQQEQLTIFYNGRVSVSHVTQGQASAILGLATEEDVDTTLRISPIDGNNNNTIVESSSDQSSDSSIPPFLLCQQPHMGFSAAAATGMKHSLQRFLQKRKRLHKNSPYRR